MLRYEPKPLIIYAVKNMNVEKNQQEHTRQGLLCGWTKMLTFTERFVLHYMREVKDVQISHAQPLTQKPKPLTLLYHFPSILSTR